MVDTVRLGGIKLSEELVQIDIRTPGSPDKTLLDLLQLIASAEINIPHLHQGMVGNLMQTSLCISAEDFLRLQHRLDAALHGMWHRVRSSVGTISFFPHRFDFAFFAKLVNCIVEHNIPLLGVSSSVSALVVHTDYTLLDKTADAVLGFAELPENHTPLRPVVVLGGEEVETIAVYWETQIRIYGIDIVDRLTCLELTCSPADLLSDRWHTLWANSHTFKHILCLQGDNERFSFLVLIDSHQNESIITDLHEVVQANSTGNLKSTADVAMISFHGPHFQDRFGIAERALSQLHTDNQTLLASGCTGTSVHLLALQQEAQQISASLTKTFVVP